MAKKKLPDMQIIEADDRGLEIGYQKMMAMIERMPDVGSIEELVAGTPALVRAAVERIQEAAEAYDAFDVIESMKMREHSLGLLGFSEREHDGIAAAVEIASLVLLARGSRSATAPVGKNPGLAVPVIHDEVQTVMLLAQMASYGQRASASAESAARSELAAVLKMYELSVRNRQFESVRAVHDVRLFGDADVASDMRATLGFDYAEYVRVRQAVQELGGERLSAAAEQFADSFHSAEAAETPDTFTPEIRAAAQAALNDLFLKPGDRAAFTAADIALRTALDESVVRATLSPFSLAFTPGDAVEVVSRYLDGVNPFVTSSLVRDSNDYYLSTGAKLGDDALRVIVENTLSGKAKERYVRARARATEEIAAEYFASMIGPDQLHPNLKYWTPADGQGPASVSAAAMDFRARAKLAEMDVLIVAEDVASPSAIRPASSVPRPATPDPSHAPGGVPASA